jgi:hypothetical protein
VPSASSVDHQNLLPIQYGTTLTLCAIMLAVAPFTVVWALLDGKQLQAPLLFTTLGASLATACVWIITENVTTTEQSEKTGDARRKAVASYVFANAAGTATVLVAHLVTTVERALKQQPFQNHDAVTLILDQLRIDRDLQVGIYVVVTLLVIGLAFWLVQHGAGFLGTKHAAGKADLAATSAASLLLFVLGLWIGTPWDVVPVDTVVAMTALQHVLHLAALILKVTAALIVLGLYCLLLAFAIGNWASVFSRSALRVGNALTAKQTWELLGLSIQHFFYGVLWAVAVLTVISSFWFFVTFVVEILPGVPPEPFVKIAGALLVGLMAAGAALITAAVCVACVLLYRLYGHHVVRAIWSVVIWLAMVAYTSLKLIALVLVFTLSVLAGAIDLFFGFFGWLLRLRPTISSGWFSTLWSIFGFDIDPPTIALRRLGLALAGVLAALLLLVSLPAIARLFEVGPTTADAGGGSEPGPVQSPGFKFAVSLPVSLCDALPGGLEWMMASHERLEIALQDCAVPIKIQNQTDGVLVVVSQASRGVNDDQEVRRAERRASALASWAARSTPAAMPIYVLDLGVAKVEDPFAQGWQLFGEVRGTRPALALLLTPFPAGSSVPTDTILQELSDALRYANVEASFSACKLSRFDPHAPADKRFVRVEQFTCAA